MHVAKLRMSISWFIRLGADIVSCSGGGRALSRREVAAAEVAHVLGLVLVHAMNWEMLWLRIGMKDEVCQWQSGWMKKKISFVSPIHRSSDHL